MEHRLEVSLSPKPFNLKIQNQVIKNEKYLMIGYLYSKPLYFPSMCMCLDSMSHSLLHFQVPYSNPIQCYNLQIYRFLYNFRNINIQSKAS